MKLDLNFFQTLKKLSTNFHDYINLLLKINGCPFEYWKNDMVDDFDLVEIHKKCKSNCQNKTKFDYYDIRECWENYFKSV